MYVVQTDFEVPKLPKGRSGSLDPSFSNAHLCTILLHLHSCVLPPYYCCVLARTLTRANCFLTTQTVWNILRSNILQLQSLKTRRSENFAKLRNIDRQILRLQNYQKVRSESVRNVEKE